MRRLHKELTCELARHPWDRRASSFRLPDGEIHTRNRANPV